MQLFIIFLLLTSIRAQQNQCLCSCCRGQPCNPTSLPTLNVQGCTLESCLGQCRTRYLQCQGNYPNGYISAKCESTITTTIATTIAPQFNCRCDCCNTGSTSCLTSYVGNTLAYSCQTGACSIACEKQYPYQCKADQNGLAEGTCIGLITTATTTTTTTTTIGSWLGNTCSCTCCQTGSNCPPISVGVTSASYCSSIACSQACRNQYPSSCLSSSNISQTSGTCISNTGENTVCGCRCCSTNGCINYKINTNGGCVSCNSMCGQYTPCGNTVQVTIQTCLINHAKTFLPSMICLLTITISTLFIIN